MFEQRLIIIRERIEIGALDGDSPYLYEIYRLTDMGGRRSYRLRIWHQQADLNPVAPNPFGQAEIEPMIEMTCWNLNAALQAKESCIPSLTSLQKYSKLPHEPS